MEKGIVTNVALKFYGQPKTTETNLHIAFKGTAIAPPQVWVTRMKSIVFSLLIMLFFVSCNKTGPRSVDTTSDHFNTLPEKIRFLRQYVTFDRQYEKLDFKIFYQNNSGGFIPGPSDWDIQIIAQIPDGSIPNWLSNAKRIKMQDADWLSAFPTNIDYSGISEWFKNGNAYIGVDRVRSIIAYRNESM